MANKYYKYLFTSIIITLLIFFFIWIGGGNPFTFIKNIIVGSLGSLDSLSFSLQYATPLIFTGLATAIAFRAGFFNIGVEGQLYIGAFAAAILGYYLKISNPFLHLSIVFIGSFLGGLLWALIPAILRVYYNVNEVISTIMMNYIALYLTNFLVMETPLRVNPALPFTHDILPSSVLYKFTFLSKASSLNVGFIISITIAVFLFILFKFTKLGYKINSVGISNKASSYAGFNVKKYMLLSMFISGGIAGLAGFEQVCGVFHHFVSPFPEGYGYLGIAVSLMAKNNPLYIILTSILFGIFDAGSSFVDIISNIPREIIFVFEGLIIIAVSINFKKKEVYNV